MKPDTSIWHGAQRDAGGPDALAEKLGIKRRTLFLWKSRGVPAERVGHVARVTGIPAPLLRPDLATAFGVTAPAPAEAAA